MDVVLGAAVTGPVARLALVDASSGQRREVVDQSTVDLGSDPARDLADAIVGTQRLLVEDGHRLAATRVCWADGSAMANLRQTLAAAGISDVAAVSQADAALAKVREVSHAAVTPAGVVGPSSAALLFCDDDTATLSIVDADTAATTVWASEHVAGSDTAAACKTLLNRLNQECGAAGSLFLMGTAPDIGDVAQQIRAATPVPLMIPDDTDLAFAHGATMAGISADPHGGAADTAGIHAEAALDSLNMGTTSQSPQIGPQLAYSQVDDSGSLPLLGASGHNDPGHIPSQSKMSPLSWADDDDEDDDTVATGALSARPRLLLLGSGVAAAVVVGFAALAVTVAAGIRPDAQHVAVAQPKSHAMPKFFPLPTNPTAPLPLDPGSTPIVQAQAPVVAGGGGTPIPAELASAIGAPAAIPPGAPAPVGLPEVPQAPVGPQLPGWGMPGFTMPPIFFNIANPVGATDTGWHWITDGHGNRWWVPNSVMGAATVLLVDSLLNNQTPGTSSNGTSSTVPVSTGTGTGQTPVLTYQGGKPILTVDQTKSGLPIPGTDQKKDTAPTLGTDKKDGPILAAPGGPDKGVLPPGTDKGANLPLRDPAPAGVPGPKDAGLLPGTDKPKDGPVLANTGGPDKSVLPNMSDRGLVPPPNDSHTGSLPGPGITKDAPSLPRVDPPSAVPPPPVSPPVVKPIPNPVAPAPPPVVDPPVYVPPKPVYVPPPVIHAPPPVVDPPVYVPPKPVYVPPPVIQAPPPPVIEAPPPVFRAPPPIFQAPSPPVFQPPQMPSMPPLFGGGGGGLFGGGGGGLFGGGGGQHH